MVSSSAGFHGLLILPGPRPSLPQEVFMFLVANVCIARFLYIWYVVNSSFESSSGGFYKQTAYK